MAFFAADKVILHYEDRGPAEALCLTLVNSLGTDLRMWDGVVPQFEDRFRIVRHDKRGHGLSDCPPAPYTMADHAGDLAALLEHLGVEETILIGISVGGMIALEYAATWPDGVRGLVLCDTSPTIGDHDMWSERIATLRAHGMDYLADAILERWFAPDFVKRHPAEAGGYRNMLVRMPVEGYAGVCAAIADADLWAAVTTLSVPALVLCGSEDVVTTPDQGQELARAMAGARFAEIDNAAHLSCIEQPVAVAEEILAFLKEQGHDRR